MAGPQTQRQDLRFRKQVHRLDLHQSESIESPNRGLEPTLHLPIPIAVIKHPLNTQSNISAISHRQFHINMTKTSSSMPARPRIIRTNIRTRNSRRPGHTHNMLPAIGRDPAIIPADALQVIVARNHVIDVGRVAASASAVRVEEGAAFDEFAVGGWAGYGSLC